MAHEDPMMAAMDLEHFAFRDLRLELMADLFRGAFDAVDHVLQSAYMFAVCALPRLELRDAVGDGVHGQRRRFDRAIRRALSTDRAIRGGDLLFPSVVFVARAD